MRSKTTYNVSASGLKVTIVVSSYHGEISDNLCLGAQSAFSAAGGNKDDCQIIRAAGAWEVPIIAKVIANENSCDAIGALGCIITGETTHDQVIGNAIANGLMKTALKWGHPISMGILTCQNIEQANERAGGTYGNKGTEAMNAAIATAVELKGRH